MGPGGITPSKAKEVPVGNPRFGPPAPDQNGPRRNQTPAPRAGAR